MVNKKKRLVLLLFSHLLHAHLEPNWIISSKIRSFDNTETRKFTLTKLLRFVAYQP